MWSAPSFSRGRLITLSYSASTAEETHIRMFLWTANFKMAAERPSSTRLADTTTLVSITTLLVIGSGLLFLLPALLPVAHSAYFALNLGHSQLVGTGSFGVLLQSAHSRWGGGNPADKLINIDGWGLAVLPPGLPKPAIEDHVKTGQR